MRIHPVFYTFVLCLVRCMRKVNWPPPPNRGLQPLVALSQTQTKLLSREPQSLSMIPPPAITSQGSPPGMIFYTEQSSSGSLLPSLGSGSRFRKLVFAGDRPSTGTATRPDIYQVDRERCRDLCHARSSPSNSLSSRLKTQEQQRLFGVIPNFYVSYDQRFVPLTTKLKYQLAFHSATDIVSIAGAGVLAGINQASDNKPDYVQGAKGYGQRFGAAYAGTVTDIFIGGAVLPRCFIRTLATFIRAPVPGNHALSTPSLLHSSPRETTVDGNSTIPALAEIWLRAQSTMRTTQTKTVAWDSCFGGSRVVHRRPHRERPRAGVYPPQSHKPLAQPELTSLTV